MRTASQQSRLRESSESALQRLTVISTYWESNCGIEWKLASKPPQNIRSSHFLATHWKMHTLADSVLYMTINKYRLLTALRRVFGGRLYFHERAWRLVFYGKGGNSVLDNLNLKHAEKITKSAFVRRARGKRWSEVEAEWSTIRT